MSSARTESSAFDGHLSIKTFGWLQESSVDRAQQSAAASASIWGQVDVQLRSTRLQQTSEEHITACWGATRGLAGRGQYPAPPPPLRKHGRSPCLH